MYILIVMPHLGILQVSVAEDDLLDGMPIVSKVNMEMYLEKRAFYFQEIVLQGLNDFLI